jgi:hypothetical protein
MEDRDTCILTSQESLVDVFICAMELQTMRDTYSCATQDIDS